MGLSISSDLYRVDWEGTPATLTVWSTRAQSEFVIGGTVGGEAGDAAVVALQDDVWGEGQALEVTEPNGTVNRMMLFNGLPFVLLQRTIVNRGGADKTVRSVSLAELPLTLGKPASDLATLGTAGLAAPDKQTGSYVFMAVADPETRAGVVGAWLTHDRGSGIVLPSVDGDAVRMTAQLDYGRLLLKPGESAHSEVFAVGWFDDARLGLEQWADLVARKYDIQLPPQLDGYCTWYSDQHGGASDETHLVELAEFAARELKPYGFDFVQIDDKWQDGERRNGPAKVFCRHSPNGPYPGGMKATADRVRSLGLTAGIWFMPFAGDHEDPFFAEKQDWFAKRPDGTPYFARWGGTCLDMTHPEAREYLAEVARLLSHDWGYKYFKMDGLWTGTATELLYVNEGYKPDDLGEAAMHRPEVTPIEAYRSGLKLVREAASDDVFLLGCCVSQNMRSFGASFGLVDAMRIGPDRGAGDLTKGMWHGSNRYFLHGRVWYNDPDPVYVRSSMPLEHARLICSWVAITGQFNVSSEWLPALPAERLDLLKRTLPTHTLKPRPVDLFESDLPRVWLLTDERDGVRRDVVGLFNCDAGRRARVEYTTERIGLPRAAAFVGFDYWADRFVPPFSGTLQSDLPAGSCRVLALRAVAAHPQVVSTSRHITQGVVDLVSERWDAEAGVLSGVSRVVAGDPYELRIVVPVEADSWQAQQVDLAGADGGATATFAQDGPKLRVRIESPSSGEVTWRVRFAANSVEVPSAQPVRDLKASVTYSRVTLAWSADAEGVRVTRMGAGEERVVNCTTDSLEDTDFDRGVTYRYEVQACNWLGELSEPVAVEVTTEDEWTRPPLPPAPNVYLSDLTPSRARTGWGKLGKGESCQGNPLTLDGEAYEKGMGVHAPSELVYALPQGARRFVAVVGIDDEVKDDPRASVVFKVLGDVKEMGEQPTLLAESPLLSDDTLRTWCFGIELGDRLKELRLLVEDAGDGKAADHADWANAGFLTSQ